MVEHQPLKIKGRRFESGADKKNMACVGSVYTILTIRSLNLVNLTTIKLSASSYNEALHRVGNTRDYNVTKIKNCK